jgi:hypothetical protein
MILLSDNDILIMLAQCNLVDEALNVFQCGLSDCFVVGAAPYSLYLNNPQKCYEKRLGNHAAFDRLAGLVQSCQRLGEANENIDLLEALSRVDGVDDGELELFLHADSLYRANHSYILTTGDKRSLKALLSSNCTLAYPSLFQTVECLESLLLKAMDLYGHAHIANKVGIGYTTTTKGDRFAKVLRVAFGMGREESATREALTYYMQDVAYFIRNFNACQHF